MRKVWRQLQREGFDVARCTVARIMRTIGLQGVILGNPVRTAVSDKAVNARSPGSTASSMLPLRTGSGCRTSLRTRRGWGWSMSPSSSTSMPASSWGGPSAERHMPALRDALEQALHDRKPVGKGGLVHHSDRGSQRGIQPVSATPWFWRC